MALFSEGEIVWACSPRWVPWPAQIMDVYNDSGIIKYTVEWLGLNHAETFEYAQSSLKLCTALHARKVLKSSGNVAYGPVKQVEYS